MADERQTDQPDLREDAFFDALALSRSTYRSAVNAAVDFALGAPSDPLGGPWTSRGGRNIGGRIRALAQSPKEPSILYAGSSQGGVYRSDDGGDTWRPLGEAHDAFPVGALGIASSNPNVVYVGSGEPGVRHRISGGAVVQREPFADGLGFFRYNAGATVPRWVEEVRNVAVGGVLPAGAANGYARIVVDPSQPERCWIASNTGLWRREAGPVFIPEPLPLGGRVRDTAARFEPPLLTASAYRRLRGGSGVPQAGPSNITSVAGSNVVTGSGFQAFLAIGDVIETTGLPVNQARVVLAVTNDTTIRVGYRSAPVTDVCLSKDWSSAARGTYRLFAAVGAQGVFRGVFNPLEVGTHWRPGRIEGGLPEPLAASGGDDIDRLRVVASVSRPAHVYTLYQKQSDDKVFALYHSSDGGENWQKREVTVGLGGQTWVNLVCEVHPDNPALVIVGAVEMGRSKDFGKTWEKILTWTRSNRGDPAQHGDQHAALFDAIDPHRLWIGNDGGVSMTTDIVASNPDIDRTWRKRSHGIVAAQFNDVAVHPSYPFILGGGLQDNGTYAGIGGETWFHRGWGDGGLMSFAPNDSRDFIATSQWSSSNPSQVWRSIVRAGTQASVTRGLWSAVLGDLPRPQDVLAIRLTSTDGGAPIVSANGPFVGIVEGHPATTPHHFLVGRVGAVFSTATGAAPYTNVGIPTAAPTPAAQRFGSGHASALAYDRTAANGALADWWVGTTRGRLFRNVKNATLPIGTVAVTAGAPTAVNGAGGANFGAVLALGDSLLITPTGGGAVQQAIVTAIAGLTVTVRTPFAGPIAAGSAWARAPWTNLVPPGIANHLITRIAVHPGNRNYLAFATAGISSGTDQGRVFLSVNRGLDWRDISGLAAAVGSTPPPQSLPPCPITGLAFDPSPAAASAQVLYASTLAGVFVVRNLPPANVAAAPVPAFNPHWSVFGNRPVTPDRFDPPLAAATAYVRIRAGAATGGAGTIASGGRSPLLIGTGTSFRAFFQLGDIVRTSGLGRDQERLVASVADDTHLLTRSRPLVADGFAPRLAAGTQYGRQPANGGAATNGGGTIASIGPAVVGSGTDFENFFELGDIIHSRGLAGGDQARVVSAIADATHLSVALSGRADDRFSPALAAGRAFSKDLRGVIGGIPGVGTVACAGTAITGSGTLFIGLFAVGDAIHVTPAGGATQTRVIASVPTPLSMTVTKAFAPTIAAGAAFAQATSGAGTVQAAGTSVTGTATAFNTFLRPGDVIHVTPSAAGASQARIVESIRSNTSLTVTVAFTPAVAAGAVFARTGAGIGTIASSAESNLVTGTGTRFTSFFRAGDVIRSGGQARFVEAVDNDSQLRTAADPLPEQPLLLVKDLAVATHAPVPSALAASPASVPRHRLIAASYGRGMLETDITPESVQPAGIALGGPRHRLYVRQYSIEDGLDLPRLAPALLNDTANPTPGRYRMNGDPRAPAGNASFTLHEAHDIRIDNAPFQFFDEVVDGVDFDESLRTKNLVPGRRNVIYVQAHTRGWGDAKSAWMHLYFAPAPAPGPDALTPPIAAAAAYQRTPAAGGAAVALAGTVTSAGNVVTGSGGTTFVADFQLGDLITVSGQSRIVADIPSNTRLLTSGVPLPDLHADFWTHHLEAPLPAPAAPPAAPAAAWQRAGEPIRLASVGPNQPAVARFDWTPPASLGGNPVALLAVVTSADDPTPANPPTQLWRLLLRQRRAALRVATAEAFVPDFYVRDGIEDDGRPGSVGYGGRSPDILVEKNAVAPAGLRATFKDLTDPRRTQEVEAGQTTHVYVRVFNRLDVEAEVEVEVLWTKTNVPTQTPDASAPPFQAAKWQRIAPTGLATVTVPRRDWAIASLQWDNVPNPDAGANGLHAVTMIALLRSTGAGDPRPVPARIHDDPEIFWRFFMDLADSNNAAMRVVRVKV